MIFLLDYLFRKNPTLGIVALLAFVALLALRLWPLMKTDFSVFPDNKQVIELRKTWERAHPGELVSPAAAQKQDIEVMSKADAIRLFAMSRQQWQQNVADAVTAGAATATGFQSDLVGMTITTPEWMVTTRVDYSGGDARPRFLHLTVAYLPGSGPTFTDAGAKEAIATVQGQMAPEFEIIGKFERLAGGQAFFFTIMETDPRGAKVK